MKLFSAFLATFLVLGSQPAQAAASYSELLVFGDSLVDSGNAQIGAPLYGLPDPAPAALGYFQGRFSNGYNFADYLSTALFGTAATPFLAPGGGTNFAIGGATAANNPAPPPPGVPIPYPPGFPQELGLFAATGQPIPSDALVLVTFGSNDVRGAIGDPLHDFSASLAAMAGGLTALADAGAQHILVTGLPDIGLLPSTLAFGAGESLLATARSEALNLQYQAIVANVAASEGIDIGYFDLFGLEHSLLADPAAYGLPGDLDSVDPCQSGGPAAVLGGCVGYLYFDAIHPTTQVHGIIAAAIEQQLGIGASVPEPETWLLMIAGFMASGATMRRRRCDLLPA